MATPSRKINLSAQLFELCPQLAALEALYPGFSECAIPGVRTTFNFEANPENLTGFIVQWGGRKQGEPELAPPRILATLQALDDPEALFAAVLTFATGARILGTGERVYVGLPVFLKGESRSVPVALIMDSEAGLTFPETRPRHDAEAIVWLMACALEGCTAAWGSK